MNLQICINELLIWGTDDWTSMGWVVGIAKEQGGAASQEDIQQLSLKMIREVLQQGLMEIGDIVEEIPNFRKWNLSVEESLQRVEREWHALREDWGREPLCGDICWLQSTAKGHEVGNRLLENESRGKS